MGRGGGGWGSNRLAPSASPWDGPSSSWGSDSAEPQPASGTGGGSTTWGSWGSSGAQSTSRGTASSAEQKPSSWGDLAGGAEVWKVADSKGVSWPESSATNGWNQPTNTGSWSNDTGGSSWDMLEGSKGPAADNAKVSYLFSCCDAPERVPNCYSGTYTYAGACPRQCCGHPSSRVRRRYHAGHPESSPGSAFRSWFISIAACFSS